MQVLRLFAVALLAAFSLLLTAEAEMPAKRLWTELNAKRQELASLNQEFEATRTFTSRRFANQSSKWRIIIDMWQGRWREASGSGDYIRVFDGKDVFAMEEGGDEYVRVSHGPKDAAPLPTPYTFTNADWAKAVEPQPRAPCGLPGPDRPCVMLQAPVKRWVRAGRAAGHTISLLDGAQRVALDAKTGMLVMSQVLEVIDDGWGGYTSDTRLALKRWSQGAPMDPSLFTPPLSGMREVKELSSWDAARIEKRLAGRPAPDMTVVDLRGQPLTLSAFKGRNVLLDFWTTWCPPCRADGTALEKLYRRYGDTELVVIGISVDEGRDVVEPFLKQHPHSYPVVLSSENELPRAYRVGVLPTYVVINKEGSITAAVEGDKGFEGLRRLLKKSGLETDE